MKGLVYIGFLLLMTCQRQSERNNSGLKELVITDSLKQKHDQDSLARIEEEAVEQGQYKTYWGYRFHIKGDFDGNGKQETLTEKLISIRTGQEIAKFCGFEEDTVPDCFWTYRVNWFRQPKCLLYCSDPAVKDFRRTADSTETIGLIALQNVGDLNGDDTDEIVYIEDLGGCNSGIRVGHLATFKRGGWKVLLDFETRLGVFPEFVEDWTVVTPEDLSKPAVKQFEQELKAMAPYFKKIKGKVFYETFDDAFPITKKLKPNW